MEQSDQTATGLGTLVQVLGPVTATVRGRPCLISSPMQRAVLSLLAVDAGRVVSVDRLISDASGRHPTGFGDLDSAGVHLPAAAIPGGCAE